MESDRLRAKWAVACCLSITLVVGLMVTIPSSFGRATPAPASAQKKVIKKKTPPPPTAKKNLKKGKNTDTTKASIKLKPKKVVKQKPISKRNQKIVKAPIKPRPSLPTQTRAEMLAEREKLDAIAQKLHAEKVAAASAQVTTDSSPIGPYPENRAPADSATDDSAQNDTELDAALESGEELNLGADEEVALDLGASGEEKWNPYSFPRSTLWMLLPLLTLMIVGLHLLPVPKRVYPRKLSSVNDFLQLRDKTRSITRPSLSRFSKTEKKSSSGDTSNGG